MASWAVSLWSRRLHLTPQRPAVWFMTPVGRFLVAAGARIARGAWKHLPQEKKSRFVNALNRQKKFWYGLGALSLIGGVAYYYTHLELTPLTNRRRFMMYSREEICQLLQKELNATDNKTLIEQMLGDAKLLTINENDFQLVDGIVKQILVGNSWCDQIHDIPWHLTVVDNPDTVNAVSLPTGDIIVYTGMIKACHNRDELGLILSHEMSHVILGHSVEGISHTGLVSMIGLIFIACIWFFVPSDILSFFMHKFFNGTINLLVQTRYSRKLELEADKIGLLLASRACFDPKKAIEIWNHLPMFNVEDTVQEYFDSHPCNVRRFMTLETILPEAHEVYNDSECETTMKREIFSFKTTAKKIFHQLGLS